MACQRLSAAFRFYIQLDLFMFLELRFTAKFQWLLGWGIWPGFAGEIPQTACRAQVQKKGPDALGNPAPKDADIFRLWARAVLPSI